MEHHPSPAVPPLVQRALALAAAHAFEDSCSDEVGQLLRILARRCRSAGELGTGFGVGACWILSGLAPGGGLVTIENERSRAVAVRDLLRACPEARVRLGDWTELLDEPPFDLLFADVTAAKKHGDDVLRAVAPGGLVVLDDLTPLQDWPSEWQGSTDPVRDYWLGHPGVAATEMHTAAGEAVILAARLP
jgi:predicted O-methyltransferase YrrM